MKYGSFAEIYDSFLGIEAEATWRAGVLRDIETLGIRKGKVLDLGTGTGIGAKLLRTMGNYHLTLLDNSAQMLAQAQCYAEKTVLSDMADFVLPGQKFDLIVSGFESVNHLRLKEFTGLLLAVKMHLRDDGAFIFDCLTDRSWHNRSLSTSYEQRVGELILVWQHKHFENNHQIQTTITLKKKAEVVWSENHIQYCFTRDMIKRSCENVGLKVESTRQMQSPNFAEVFQVKIRTT